MKALVYQGPKRLELEDRTELADLGDEVVVDVASVGICGSDMHAFLGHDERRPAPLILGHEAAGIERSTGRRVTVNPLQSCGTCDACARGQDNLCPTRAILSMPPREGAFAGSVMTRPANLVEVPAHVSFDQASLAEPLACGWHTVMLGLTRLNRPIAEAVCVVQGGGAIGLGVALCLKAQGAVEIWVAETNPARHPAIEQAGPFKIFDPSKSAGPGENSAHLIIDAVGIDPTRAAASAMIKPGGVIVHIGLGSGSAGFDIRRITLQEITVIGSYTYTPQEFRDTAQAIFDGRLGALDWMDIRPLDEGQRAFDEVIAGKVAAPKIILRP